MSYKTESRRRERPAEGTLEEVSQEVRRGFLARLLEFIKFSHTLFALPFAFASAVLAVMRHDASGAPQFGPGFWWSRGLLILAAMVFARTAAMTFNRLADWDLDQRNPRTARRHQLIPRWAAMLICVASSALFVGVCFWINPLAFRLSPIALGTIYVYSFTKRFTHFSHFFLGFALALSPLGAWVAVTGELGSLIPWILAAVVVFWVAGFDMIYAIQDIDFDRSEELQSLAAKLGGAATLELSRVLHAVMFLLLLVLGAAANLRGIYDAGLAIIAAILFWEHRLALKHTPEAIQVAFFRANALISFVLMFSILIESLRS